MAKIGSQTIVASSDPTTTHPDYPEAKKNWDKIRDCIAGEERIKSKTTKYLPQPEGMKNEYADAYEAYVERAHFPLISTYALQGALGVIITKLPEFELPKQLEYLQENATKDGISLRQLFLDTVIEILQTGRCPLVVDIDSASNKFKFVKYTAESFINWKSEVINSEKNLILAVFQEEIPENEDIFSHDTIEVQRVFYIDESGNFATKVFGPDGEYEELAAEPSYMGKRFEEIPVFIAGSITNTYEIQPIPLLAVANCSIQIYRKEADLANSEFLSCNPTLIFTGVSNDDDLPNVVGSSVMIALPDPQSRGFYTTTDTDALSHVKNHINDLYEEAIRHGVSILETRKGVEAAEALRIRQATQSATIYSIYLSALSAIRDGVRLMCRWSGIDESKVRVDAPSTLTYDIPESSLIKELIDGFVSKVVPIHVVHRYMVSTGLLDQSISLTEYIEQLNQKDLETKTPVNPEGEEIGGKVNYTSNENNSGNNATNGSNNTNNGVNNNTGDNLES